MKAFFVCQDTPSGIQNQKFFFNEEEADKYYDKLCEGDNVDYLTRIFVCDTRALQEYEKIRAKKIVKGTFFISGHDNHLYGTLAANYKDFYDDEEAGEVIHIAVLGYEYDMTEDEDTGEWSTRVVKINEEVDDYDMMEAYGYEIVDVEDDNEAGE